MSLVELMVAAAVLLIASVGVFEALAGALRDAEHHQQDLVAERLLLSSIGYLRDVGYDGLIASGSTQVTEALTTIYAQTLAQLGTSSALSVEWTQDGQMLDATVSAIFPVPGATGSMDMATRIAEGGPP